MSRDGEYKRAGKTGPGKYSVPESGEVRFRKEGTISRAGPYLSIKKKGDKEGSFGLALSKFMTL